MFSIFNLKYILQKVCQRDKYLMLKGMSFHQVGEKCTKPHILRAKSHTFPTNAIVLFNFVQRIGLLLYRFQNFRFKIIIVNTIAEEIL